MSLASPLGQIVPCIVERKGDLYALIDGRRRRLAALTLDSDEHPFYLSCVVRENGTDALRTAVIANWQRKGYNSLQLAYLCKAIREAHGWTGTKEVAEYLSCSRAQVQKADKLLTRPAGMDQATYDGMIVEIAAGTMRADTALWCLTHVKPEDIPIVMALAQDIAIEEQIENYTPQSSGESGLEAQGEVGGSVDTSEDQETLPAVQEPHQQSNKKSSKDANLIPEGKWAKEARKKSKERKAAAKAAKVEKRHVKAAAKKVDAVKTGADAPKARGRAAQPDHTALQRTLPDLRKLFEVLKGSSYPDVMRNFVSLLGDSWWRGDATDKEVISHWSQIAVAVELGQKIDHAKSKQSGKKAASKKAKK